MTMLERLGALKRRFRPGRARKALPPGHCIIDGRSVTGHDDPVLTGLVQKKCASIQQMASAGAARSVVVFVPFALFPTFNGGAERIKNYLRHLKSSGIHVVLVVVAHADQGHVSLEPLAHTIFEVDDARADPRDLGISTEHGLHVLRRYNQAFEFLAPKLNDALAPVAAIAAFAHGCFALRHFGPHTLRIADTHDLQHVRLDIAALHGGYLPGRECSREQETQALSHADFIVAINREEAAAFEEMLPTHVVLTIGFARTPEPLPEAPPDRRTLAYIANDYDPNNRGIRAFIEGPWRRIVGEFPDAVLSIAGTVCDAVKGWDGVDLKGVTLLGYVKSLEELYGPAAVVINPCLYGTGQKIKSIEAFAFGRCLVATEAGCGGLPDDAACLKAGLQDMGDVIAGLFRDPGRRAALEEAARKYAAANLAPDIVYGPLLEIIDGWSTRIAAANLGQRPRGLGAV